MLANYLETPQAREDVRALLDSCDGAENSWAEKTLDSGLHWMTEDAGAWWRVGLADSQVYSVYYRPDGDRYVVTDLGEGVRALRLKGCALLDIKPKVDEVLMQMYQAGLLHPNYGPAALIQGEIGTIGNVTAADLPDALCRVMLASLKVSEVQP